MNRKVLYLPLAIFLILAAALMWQLMRNSDGDDPTVLESALVGKPLPDFRPASLENRMSCWIPLTLSMVNRC